MIKQLDWDAKQARAKQMSKPDLVGALVDCIHTAECGVDEGYYLDEASVYRLELMDRGNTKGEIDVAVEKGLFWLRRS